MTILKLGICFQVIIVNAPSKSKNKHHNIVRSRIHGIFQQSQSSLIQTKPIKMISNNNNNDDNSNSNHSNEETNPSSSNNNNSRCIEIEEKFTITNDENGIHSLETKLVQLGFEKVGGDTATIEFMDWYFDLPDPNWILSTSDNWLRYRELIPSASTPTSSSSSTSNSSQSSRKGSWQLKCGKSTPNHDNNDQVSSSTTVYEEFENDEALEKVLLIMQENKQESSINMNYCTEEEQQQEEVEEVDELEEEKITHSSETTPLPTMDGYEIPTIPPSIKTKIKNQYHDNMNLVPFARIKTTRSSWKCLDNTNDLAYGLSVDIDCTDFGYMVGEVEQVVDNEEDISLSKERIGKLIEQITTGVDETMDSKRGGAVTTTTTTTTYGKLELFMIRNRQKHFEACLNGGSMKSKPSV